MPFLSGTCHDLILTYRFTIARSSKTQQQSLIVRYSDQGITGFGECTSHEYYNFSAHDGLKRLKEIAGIVCTWPQDRPEGFYARLLTILPDTPFLRCAIDQAYWDWYGKKHHKTTRDLLCINADSTPITSYTIGIGSIDEMKNKVAENPWSSYKIKLSADQDWEFISELLDYIEQPVCIDANTSWSEVDLKMMDNKLPRGQVQFIEQPMARENWETLKRLKDELSIPIIADESCINEMDLLKCRESFHGVNIKLMKCGGITPAYKMIKAARQMNLKVMIGCMTESSIGISAAAQLAPLVDFVDLDGAMLISNDPATGVKWSSSAVEWPTTAGNGVQIRL